MRVIAGSARGRSLLAPRGLGTRPMMDIVKGSLFNMLEARGGVEGKVLDLFAGSGSLGIEALSRGAEWVDFVEANREACRVLRENLARLGFADQAKVATSQVRHFLSSARQRYDLIFMDAPYADRVSASLLERLAHGDLLAEGGRVCVGHACAEALPDTVGVLSRARLRRFGASCLSLYETTGATGIGDTAP